MSTNREEYNYEPVAGTEDPSEQPTAQFSVENGNVTIQSPSTMSSDKSAKPADRKFLYIAACVGKKNHTIYINQEKTNFI